MKALGIDAGRAKSITFCQQQKAMTTFLARGFHYLLPAIAGKYLIFTLKPML